MDERTIKYYDDNAEKIYLRYEAAQSPIVRYLRLAFRPGAELLDIGAGSGRDLRVMIREGYEAYGAEPSDRLRSIAIAKDPSLAARLTSGSLPGLAPQLDREFDGVVCSAVFMHIPEQQQFDAAFDIRSLLKRHGRLLLSIPRTRSDVQADSRDTEGRLFVQSVPESVQLLFERLGFQCIGIWEDEDLLGRPGFTWTTLLLELRTGEQVRPIDQIEGVLNRDRKVATYKLALFRALADIAMTGHRAARWRSDGFVGIPVRSIAERWVYYYWPLLDDGSLFIPQIRGEKRDGRLRIGFRPHLDRLIAEFRQAGGLDGFAIAYRNDSLTAHQRDLLRGTLAKLVSVIVQGPVTYAGGALGTGRLFRFDSAHGHVIVSPEIWRELSLSGHWIQDALILRWAELTAEISSQSIAPSEVIDCLLRVPTFDRNVQDAKRVFLNMQTKECAWSGVSLGNRFEVDHVLPFSLWRNNDLWNLLPTTRAMNQAKRDGIPTTRLLRHRKDVIVGYWDAVRGANPCRFEHELTRLTGGTSQLEAAFNLVVEAAEITALQRGCLRWEPA